MVPSPGFASGPEIAHRSVQRRQPVGIDQQVPAARPGIFGIADHFLRGRAIPTIHQPLRERNGDASRIDDIAQLVEPVRMCFVEHACVVDFRIIHGMRPHVRPLRC